MRAARLASRIGFEKPLLVLSAENREIVAAVRGMKNREGAGIAPIEQGKIMSISSRQASAS